VTRSVPPELLSPEDREAHAAWLRHRIGAGWLRFVVLEAIFIGIPVAAILVAWVLDAISKTAMIVLLVLVIVADAAFTLYWARRMSRLNAELEALETFTTQ